MLAEQIHAYLRRGAGYQRTQVGPFLATFSPGSDHPMRNYAIPDDGAAPSARDVAALLEVYRQRGLKPRLEYLSAAAPAVEPALLRSGFVVEARIPVLAIRPGDQPRAPAALGIEVTMAADDADHIDAMMVAAETYGEKVEIPPSFMVEARKAMVSSGGGVAVARIVDGRQAVGSGLYPVPRGGG